MTTNDRNQDVDGLAQVLAEHGEMLQFHAVAECNCGEHLWDWQEYYNETPDEPEDAFRAHQAAVVLAHLTAEGWITAESVYPMIRDLTDPEGCWFDHHGGCQAHGYLFLEPGEVCPQQEAKDWLKAHEPAGEVAE